MQTVILSIAAFAALVAAQSKTLYFTTTIPKSLPVGQPITIGYASPDSGSPVTILLREGDRDDLQTVSTLTSSSTGGSYVWTPSSSLVSNSDYALQITQGDEVNYFGPFSLTGGAASSAASSSATSAASSTGSATITGSSSSTGSALYVPSSSAARYPAGNGTHAMSTGILPPRPIGTGNAGPIGNSSLTPSKPTPSTSAGGSSSTPAATTRAGNLNGAGALGSSLGLVFAAFAAVAFLQ